MQSSTNLDKYITRQNLTVVQAMQKIDAGAKGILFVCDADNRLLGCVTDGDIRRYIIKTGDLNGTLEEFMFKTPRFVRDEEEIDFDRFLEAHSIGAVPVVDAERKILRIVFRNASPAAAKRQPDALRNVPVIIMAGGKGTRLYPYTKILPKPLIPIGDIPIIERIINRYTAYGVDRFHITVNYKKGMIKSYFEELNPPYELVYVNEDKPLGTGGSISLIEETFEKPVIVANCDCLIEADLSDIYNEHLLSGNAITVVSSMKNFTVPYGVLHVKEQGRIESLEEKPSLSYMVNTGMYVINPEMLELIPQDTVYHMTQLIEDAMKAGHNVGVYPISEEAFLDMGEAAEMKRMEEKLNV